MSEALSLFDAVFFFFFFFFFLLFSLAMIEFMKTSQSTLFHACFLFRLCIFITLKSQDDEDPCRPHIILRGVGLAATYIFFFFFFFFFCSGNGLLVLVGSYWF